MRRRTKFYILFLVLFFVALIFYQLWIAMREAAYPSCLGSIATGIQETEAVKDLTPSNGADWKVLSEKEVDLLLSQFQPGDCLGFENTAVDFWGNRIQVALRAPTGGFDIKVWSRGPDGISSTEDDLVIPWGEKPPQ
jgi:hypothetical protein